MTNVSNKCKSNGNNRYWDGAMGNGCEPSGTSEKLEDFGGSRGGTDCDGHEKEMGGMFQAFEKKR